RALRTFSAGHRKTVDGPVSVTGFSQGANITFQLGRALQQGADRHFSLDAMAPISGAYSLFDVEVQAALTPNAVHPVRPDAAAYYMAYFTVAWNRIYHLYDNESEVFKAPYAGHVADLFDGTHEFDDTVTSLPTNPGD